VELREARLREERARSCAEDLARRLEESEQHRGELRCRLKALEGASASLPLDDVRPHSGSGASASSRRPTSGAGSSPPAPLAALPRGAAGVDQAAEDSGPGTGADAGSRGDVTRRHTTVREGGTTIMDPTEGVDFVLPGGTGCEEASASGTTRREDSRYSTLSQSRLAGTGDTDLGDNPSVSLIAARTMDLPDLLREDALSKMSGEEESTASTCTTVMQMLYESSLLCYQCNAKGLELFLDHTDMNRYCEQCWVQFYGQRPSYSELLVPIEVSDIWSDRKLEREWADRKLQGWPPVATHPPTAPASREGEVWSNVRVRLRRDVVGSHARELKQHGGRLSANTVLADRYCVQEQLGEGHFTKAFLATDLVTGNHVCLKRHNGLSMDALTDLLVLARRLEQADALGESFPRLMDAFYDVVGYTVESLVDGQNCSALAKAKPGFFEHMANLRVVAHGVLAGLVLLDRAGVVHNDLKPDNLVWAEAGVGSPRSTTSSRARPCVRIVDFGCARLDRREEPGRNWSLAEGGAGHLGKWSPEMVLRLPITHRGDVWGLAISLCELHCGRLVWCHQSDTAEVVLAQSLGLCGHREGVPASLLRRSPLDVRKLYTPAPRHWPVRRQGSGQLQVLQPRRWGLEVVLGSDWGAGEKRELGDFLRRALVLDAEHRPSAADLLEGPGFACEC